MILRDIIERFGDLKIQAKRAITDAYCELVFYSKDTAAWEKVITDLLGPAVKPPRANPSREDLRITEAYGGIQAGQTLFKKNFEGYAVMAMFWPWQDKAHATLKIAVTSESV